MAGAVSLAGGGVVVASWTAGGAGTGTARAITATLATVSGRDGVADLYPGFSDGDVSFTVTNANPYPVRFTSATFGPVASANPAACPSANVTVDPSVSGLSIDVPANTTTAINATLADVVNMVSSAPDGCQGVSFSVTVTLSGSQL